MSDKNVVVSNKIVKGRYSFTKEEQNFIYHVISQISKEDKDFYEYEVCISHLEKLDLRKKNHVRFKNFAVNLITKKIILRDEETKTTTVTSWFSSISHTDGTSVIKACFDPKLKPYLIQLKNEFVQAKLPVLLSFKSKYASRLYLLLKSDYDRQNKYRKNLFVIYDIDDLISRFEMPKSYKERYSLFKNDFLDKVIEEINEKTELKIIFKELKTGRKITSIEFCIGEKEKSHEQQIKELIEIKTKSDYIPEGFNSKSLSVICDDELGFTNNDIKNIFDNYRTGDIEDICLDLWKCWESAKIISKQGYFRGRLKKINNL